MSVRPNVWWVDLQDEKNVYFGSSTGFINVSGGEIALKTIVGVCVKINREEMFKLIELHDAIKDRKHSN